MKHTARMYLIPEEVYVELTGDRESGSTPLGMIREHMSRIEKDPTLGADAKGIQYQQEFKRYYKLFREAEERPVDVKLQNIEDITNKIQKEIATPIAVTAVKAVKKSAKKSGHAKTETEETPAETNEGDEVFHSVSEEPSIAEKKNRAMAYIRENAGEMGVKDDHVLKWVGNKWSVIVGSSVDNIVDHILAHQGQRVRPIRVGYDEFMRRVANHPKLAEILSIPTASSSSQTGHGPIGKMQKKYKKTAAAPTLPFKFKPVLW